MDTLAKEIRHEIFEQCDLESLVALRQTSKFFSECLDEFDDSVIREKVLERAPWFQTNSGFDSWNACACALVARTKACLAGQFYETKWLLINNFEAAMRLQPKVTLVDPQDISEYNSDSKLLFPDSFIKTPGSWHAQGSKVLVRGMELDLNTMVSGPNPYCPDKLGSASLSYSEPTVTSPSGLKLRSHDGKNRIQVQDENDKLLLVRVQTQSDESEDEDEDEDGPALFSFVLEDEEHVVYKDTCPRDEEGVLIIDQKDLIEMDTARLYGMAFFKLLPGAGGALVTKLFSSGDENYLAYIHPTADLRHSVIAFLPSIRRPQAMEYDHALPKNYFLYNGYLYYYFEGRLFRLWVDLGKEKRIERSRVKNHKTLPQQYDTQCLAACHGLFPAMGTFCEQSLNFDRHNLIQGSKENGLDRYVTVSQASGYVVGDLKTGQTWQVNEFGAKKHHMFPWLDGSEVKFYKLDNYLCTQLQKKMYSMRQQSHKRFNFAKVYDGLKEQLVKRQETEHDTRKLMPRPLYYTFSGAAIPPALGPYVKGRRIRSDGMIGVPGDYKTTESIREEMKDVVVDEDEDDGYDSDEEYSNAATAYNRAMDKQIRLCQEAQRVETWYTMFDEVHRKFGSRTTNDPQDPTNLAARKRFMSGAIECYTSPWPVPSSSDPAFHMGYIICEGNSALGYGPPECMDDAYIY